MLLVNRMSNYIQQYILVMLLYMIYLNGMFRYMGFYTCACIPVPLPEGVYFSPYLICVLFGAEDTTEWFQFTYKSNMYVPTVFNNCVDVY